MELGFGIVVSPPHSECHVIQTRRRQRSVILRASSRRVQIERLAGGLLIHGMMLRPAVASDSGSREHRRLSVHQPVRESAAIGARSRGRPARRPVAGQLANSRAEVRATPPRVDGRTDLRLCKLTSPLSTSSTTLCVQIFIRCARADRRSNDAGFGAPPPQGRRSANRPSNSTVPSASPGMTPVAARGLAEVARPAPLTIPMPVRIGRRHARPLLMRLRAAEPASAPAASARPHRRRHRRDVAGRACPARPALHADLQQVKAAVVAVRGRSEHYAFRDPHHSVNRRRAPPDRRTAARSLGVS